MSHLRIDTKRPIATVGATGADGRTTAPLQTSVPGVFAVGDVRALVLIRRWPLLPGGSAYVPRGPVGPGTPWVVEEAGEGSGAADAPVEAAHENVFLDISSYGPRAIRLCADALGEGQIVFGTDAPVVDPLVVVRSLAGCGAELERLVREETPARLLA